MYAKKDLIYLWEKENIAYQTKEIGSGVQLFVKKLLQCPEIFNLKEANLTTPEKDRKQEFLEESSKKQKRADVIVYIDNQIVIPMEIERLGNINAGEKQLFQYQLVWDKKTGILTDGFEWRFYIGKTCLNTFTLTEIFEKTEEFLVFWKEYTQAINYYRNFFKIFYSNDLLVSSQASKEEDLNVEENRQNFFTDITTLIESFQHKLNLKGYFSEAADGTKQAIELTYAYIIQFILYKTLADNNFNEFRNDFAERIKRIETCLDIEVFGDTLTVTKAISQLVSKNIYKSFKSEQAIINEKVEELLLKPKNDLPDVTPWLDIFVFIKRYSFADIRNEIFGFIYENYLKQLYNENLGQYFTSPEVVNFMLDEIGYNGAELVKNSQKDQISIIDPSCGSGTFLYSAVRNLIENLPNQTQEDSEYIEKIINENIFGVDVAEFPLYLAEMSIIMRMLPLILNEDYTNVLDKKIKVFKTKDSVAEFLDTAVKNTAYDLQKQSVKDKGQGVLDFGNINLGYKSFIRDEDNLKELKQSLENLQNPAIERYRFDYVIGNPPYISYKECTQQKILSFQFMKEGKLKLSDIYGVNLHSVPENPKKYAPNPNLYAFFIALGLGLLKQGGKMAYIIPQTLLVAGDLDVLRYHLAKYITIEKIYTFSSQMFVERGLKQNKTVVTSSLIIFLKKELPAQNHLVTFKHFIEKDKNIDTILQGKYLENKVLQTGLLDNILNWNYLQQDNYFLNFYQEYKLNPKIEVYYQHSLAKKELQSVFYFDRGLKFPKDKISEEKTTENSYFLPFIQKNKLKIQAKNEYILANLLDFPFGSQGENVYKATYKIVWSYMNFHQFYFSDENIMLDYNYVLISSDNKNEILYLLGLLNSSVSTLIFDKLLRLPHEQDILIGIKTIKDFIKIPIINAENQDFKTQIITLTQKLLDLETVKLADLVDFSDVLMQKFESLAVENGFLLLKNENKITKCKIKDKTDLVAIFAENPPQDLTLKALKSQIVIDENEQSKLKKQINDLVFCLYFKVQLADLQTNTFYQYLENGKR